MGRYYSGDIEGKFWFGVQDSNDASFFGGIESEPNYREYYFSEEHVPEIEKGIKECLEKLGDNKKKLDNFFDKHNLYNNEMLTKAGFPKEDQDYLLEWYARLDLGQKILDCVKKNGSCSLDAEY